MRLHSAASLVALTSILFAPGAHAESAQTMADRLAAMRAEVDALSGELSLKQLELREQTSAHARRRAELEGDVKRESMRVEQLNARRAVLEKAIKERAERGAEVKPVVLSTLDALHQQIDTGLPFQKAERLKAVAELKAKVEGDSIAAPDALVRTWSLIQDELKLTRENGLYRQTITLHGEERLVDVARVGMVLLYFQASDGLCGRAIEGEDGEWTYEAFDAPEDKANVVALIDAFKKQIRTGYFELPVSISVAPGAHQGSDR